VLLFYGTLAALTWYWLQPELAACAEFAPGWILLLLARNASKRMPVPTRCLAIQVEPRINSTFRHAPQIRRRLSADKTGGKYGWGFV
jgi:hypothetical protein